MRVRFPPPAPTRSPRSASAIEFRSAHGPSGPLTSRIACPSPALVITVTATAAPKFSSRCTVPAGTWIKSPGPHSRTCDPCGSELQSHGPRQDIQARLVLAMVMPARGRSGGEIGQARPQNSSADRLLTGDPRPRLCPGQAAGWDPTQRLCHLPSPPLLNRVLTDAHDTPPLPPLQVRT